MRHQTAMFSEAILLRFDTTIKNIALYMWSKLPLNISFCFDIMILWVFIYLWLQFWIFVSLHTETPHTDHMLQLAIIASSALFLLGLSGSRSRNMSQLAIFAHDSHFSWATEIGFISSSSWTTQLSLTQFLLGLSGSRSRIWQYCNFCSSLLLFN